MKRMWRFLVFCGALGFIGLVTWFGVFLSTPGLIVSLNGKGFNEPTFSAVARDMLTHGEAVRDMLVARSGRWTWLYSVAGWVSLACTSSVTLLAGIFGKKEGEPDGRRSQLLFVIGLAGAVASASTAFSSYAKGQAQDAEKTAISLTTTLQKAVDGIRLKPEAEAATLIELKTAIDLAAR